MDYKFTFKDGSEALVHYGVKGMKWGVQNAETKARYAQAGMGLQGGGGGMIDTATETLSTVADKIEEGREKLDSTFDNPLYLAKQRIEKAESSGENDEARKRLKERYSKDNAFKKASDKKNSSQKNVMSQKQRNEYQRETRLNKLEFHGDVEGYRKAQKRTDDLYGKNGRKARALEIRRLNKANKKAISELKNRS